MTYQMQKTKSLSLHSPIKSSHIINFHTTKYSRPHTNPPLKIHIHNIIIKKKKKKKKGHVICRVRYKNHIEPTVELYNISFQYERNTKFAKKNR